MGGPLSYSLVRGPASPTGFSSGPSWVVLRAGRRAHLLTAVDLNSTGPCPLLNTVATALGTSERKSDGEASGNVGSPLVNTSSRARPGGQDSSGHHVAFWEVSPSAWPWGPGEECLRVPSFLVSGPQEQTLRALPGGRRWHGNRGWGLSALAPEGPFPPQCVLRAGPGGRGPWPRGTRGSWHPWGETHSEAARGSELLRPLRVLLLPPGSRFQNVAFWAPSCPWEPGLRGGRLCKGEFATHPLPTPSNPSLFPWGRGEDSTPVSPRENSRL